MSGPTKYPPSIQDGTYLIKSGIEDGVGGEYITGGSPGTIFTIQAERPNLDQKYKIRFQPEKGAYTIEIDQNFPINIGLAYEGPVANIGQPVIVEVPRLFYIVPIRSAPPSPNIYKIIPVETEGPELVVAVSPKKINPPELYFTTPGTDNSEIWYLRMEVFD